MPRLSVWFIRASLMYLAAGFTLGALMLANKGLRLEPFIWRLLPAHIEVMLVGWTVQLAMGVAYWILPRFQSSRGNTRAAWLAFVLLNGGVLLAVAAIAPGAPAGATLAGRLLQAAAAIAFAVNAWPRVKPVGV
ncbi:MAG: hypothetical protein KDI55_04905 [Anaerolineae bacterium]|nr:hypothetical protein [Anaerolineae bacterium]